MAFVMFFMWLVFDFLLNVVRVAVCGLPGESRECVFMNRNYNVMNSRSGNGLCYL